MIGEGKIGLMLAVTGMAGANAALPMVPPDIQSLIVDASASALGAWGASTQINEPDRRKRQAVIVISFAVGFFGGRQLPVTMAERGINMELTPGFACLMLRLTAWGLWMLVSPIVKKFIKDKTESTLGAVVDTKEHDNGPA